MSYFDKSTVSAGGIAPFSVTTSAGTVIIMFAPIVVYLIWVDVPGHGNLFDYQSNITAQR